MDSIKFSPHEIEWNNKNISTFWNYVYSMENPNSGFSEIVGRKLIKKIKSKINVRGNILDYSSGFGYIIKYLLESSKSCNLYGTEYSDEGVKVLNNNFEKHEDYKGSKLIKDNTIPWPDNHFDIVFLTEVLEHIPQNDINGLINEFARILKTKGKLIITVPNNENLEEKQQLCPECGAIFHPVQHINSFNSENLNKLLLQFGFTKLWIKETYLTDGKFSIKKSIKRLYFICKKKMPHLIFIAEKS